MLWSKFGNNPEWTWDIFGEEFEEVVYKHVDDTMDHFNSLGVVHWDVINEMIDEHQGPLNHTFYLYLLCCGGASSFAWLLLPVKTVWGRSPRVRVAEGLLFKCVVVLLFCSVVE